MEITFSLDASVSPALQAINYAVFGEHLAVSVTI